MNNTSPVSNTINPSANPLGYNYNTVSGTVANSANPTNSTLSSQSFLPSTTLPAADLSKVIPTINGVSTPSGTQSDAHLTLGAAVTPPPVDPEAQRNQLMTSLASEESGNNPGQETLNLDQSSGLNTAQQQKQYYDTQIAQTSSYFDNQISNLTQNNPAGELTDSMKGQIQTLQNNKNYALAPLAILQASATGDVTRLTDLVTKSVNAYTDQMNSQVKSYQDMINNIDADPVEKAQLTAQANAQQAKLDSVKTASADALKTAAQNGAPSSVLDAIGKASADPNATATSIYQAAGKYMQTKGNVTPFQPVNGTGGDYVPIDTTTISDKNAPNSAWGGLSYNGLMNDAQHFLSTGTMPSLGLGTANGVQNARLAIQNYAGQLADDLGMTQPQIQAMYKANSSSATQIIERMAKIDTISSSATTQFPRLADLADKIKALGITEADVQAGAAKAQSKFGSVDASNYIELIQTIRGDYAGLQSAMGGSSRGSVFFNQKADVAIPAGLTGAQYLGIMQTLQQSATNVSQATQNEANNLIGTGSGNPTGEAGGGVPAAPTTTPAVSSSVQSILDKYGVKI